MAADPSASAPTLLVPWAHFWRRIVNVILFTVPVTYSGLILSTAIHEIVGHGVTALLVGGDFRGFTLEWNAMGWAQAWEPPGAMAWQEITVLAGGALSTFAFGALLLAGAWLTPANQFLLRLTFVLMSITSLLDGLVYWFWNAVHPVPPGDLGRILALSDSVALRLSVLIVCGAMSVVALVIFFTMFFQAVESWIGGGIRLIRGQRALALLVIVVLPGVPAWTMFDWDQVIPGLGAAPALSGVMVQVLAAVMLYAWSPQPAKIDTDRGRIVVAIAGAWIVAAVLLASIWLWLRAGVSW